MKTTSAGPRCFSKENPSDTLKESSGSCQANFAARYERHKGFQSCETKDWGRELYEALATTGHGEVYRVLKLLPGYLRVLENIYFGIG